MSKLSFRARALDPSKQMPIYLAEELPDLPEYSAINRAVPQMPSGMEKEEESEHHLQRAICTGLIIPTPEVYTTNEISYDKNYPPDYKMPRQLIHMQPLGLEQDVPDYDMDSADEVWVNQQSRRLDLTPLKFEQMMDRLEKSSGQTVITLNEAKALLKQNDEISIAVYDYWLNKRLKTQHPLILSVKTENRPGASSNNPYLAFRRRTEKMQTRKNRKNDETSYEKMLKLRRDLQRATTMLEMVKRREKTKREHLHLSIEIFEKRVQIRDFNGSVFSELSASYKNSRLAFAPLYSNQYAHHPSLAVATPTSGMPNAMAAGGGAAVIGANLLSAGALNSGAVAGVGHSLYSTVPQYLNSSGLTIDAGGNNGTVGNSIRKEKRQYKKRKHKLPRDKQQQQHQQYLAGVGGLPLSGSANTIPGHHGHHHLHHHHLHRQSSSPAANESNIETEEEEYGPPGGHHAHKIGSESEDELPYAFRRKQNCDYLRATASTSTCSWPWERDDENNIPCDTNYRFTLTSVRNPRPRCIGFARRRLGRGGRLILDRVATNYDDLWSQLDYTILESGSSDIKENLDLKRKRKRPHSPPTVVDLPAHKIPANTIPPISNNNKDLARPANTAVLIKTELSLKSERVPALSVAMPMLGLDDEGNESDVSDDADELFDDQIAALWLRYKNEEICPDNQYVSQPLLALDRRQRLLRKHRKEILLLEQQRRLNAVKRSASETTKPAKRVNGTVSRGLRNVSGMLAKTESSNERKLHQQQHQQQQQYSPLPKAYLQRLAQCLEFEHFDLPSIENIKQEEVLGEQQEANISPSQNEASSLSVNQLHHRSNIVLNNNNSSSNIDKNFSLTDKFNNVIKTETTSLASSSAVRSAAMSPSAGGCISESESSVPSVTVKQEMLDSISCASAEDSNEPLSSIQKPATLTTKTNAVAMLTDIALEDEENVNLAQLSNLIKHTVKKELLEDTSSLDAVHSNTVSYQQQKDQQPAEADVKLAAVKDELLLGKSPLIADDEDDDDDSKPVLNQVEDVVRVANIRRVRLKQPTTMGRDTSSSNADESNLSPSSSQRLEACQELLNEIRQDWLHFRPKTPTDELSDYSDSKLSTLEGSAASGPLVNWSKQTPIKVEMLRCAASPTPTPPMPKLKRRQEETLNSLLVDDGNSNDNMYISSCFKYEELEPDTQLLNSFYLPEVLRGSSKSPDGMGNSSLDFNFSGDSLTDINLLGEADEADENMLDNILQECQIDDIKTLNQATNFWNGILDGESAEVVDDDDEDLLGWVDAKKSKNCSRTRVNRSKNSRHRTGSAMIGTSLLKQSSILNGIKDDVFFAKEAATQEVVVKEEPATGTKKSQPPPLASVQSNSVAPSSAASTVLAATRAAVASGTSAVSTTTLTTVPISSTMPVVNAIGPQVTQLPSNVKALLPAQIFHPSMSARSGNIQQFINVAQQPHLVSAGATQIVQAAAHSQQLSELHAPAVGDIITVTGGGTSSSGLASATTMTHAAVAAAAQHQPQQQHQHQQQQHQQSTQAQQPILQLQQPASQLRSVTVQQIHQQQRQQQQQHQHQQQQHQHQHQQQQQQLMLQMQRDLVTNAPVITQYVTPTSLAAGGSGNASIATLRQPTLTPIGSTGSGNLIYTTTSNDGVSGIPQKIFIQKAPAIVASSHAQQQQVRSSAGTNAALIVSNVKLDNSSSNNDSPNSGGQQKAACDTSGNANTNTLTVVSSAMTSNATVPTVNIISTSGSQQPMSVHSFQQSLGGVSSGNVTNITGSSTPLIVTTAAAGRNNAQLAQQQSLQIQPAQQIVWRQISTANAANSAGVLKNIDATGGNKILVTSRPAQKRQLNGPDGSADLNKLLLNRKLSQRKIITQQVHQHQQQQQLQQLQALNQIKHLMQLDEDGSQSGHNANVSSSSSAATNDVMSTTQTIAAIPTQQQLQKIQMQGGKVIKMSSFPLIVSELSLQQQQQQQAQLQAQKQNSVAAISANHNYSLQPATAAIITSQAAVGQGSGVSGGGNKIYLTSAAGGSIVSAGTNFTIATASDLQAAQGLKQKFHYKDLQNSNLKVNIVTTSGAGGVTAMQAGNIVVDAKTLSAAAALGGQQVVLNKASAGNSAQTKINHERILNIISAQNVGSAGSGVASNSTDSNSIGSGSGGSGNNSPAIGSIVSTSSAGSTPENVTATNKRVLYTNLLKKSNAGQVMQIGHGVLRGRQIFTNVRSAPITAVPSTSASVGGVQVIASNAGNVGNIVPVAVTSSQFHHHQTAISSSSNVISSLAGTSTIGATEISIAGSLADHHAGSNSSGSANYATLTHHNSNNKAALALNSNDCNVSILSQASNIVHNNNNNENTNSSNINKGHNAATIASSNAIAVNIISNNKANNSSSGNSNAGNNANSGSSNAAINTATTLNVNNNTSNNNSSNNSGGNISAAAATTAINR